MIEHKGLCETRPASERARAVPAPPRGAGRPRRARRTPAEERARVVGSVERQEALCNLLLPDLRPRLSRARTRQRVRGGRRRRAEAPRSRRASRRSRRQACRPSRPHGAPRTIWAASARRRAGRARTPATGSGSSSATWSTREPLQRRATAPRRLVAEVEGVGHDPDVVGARLVEQRERRRRARSTKPAVSRCAGWIGSKPSAHARLAGRGRAPPEPVDDDRPALRPPSAAAERPAQAEHALGLVGREAPDRGADRLDALLGVGRSLHPRDRELEERRHGRECSSRPRARRRAAADVGRIVVGQLELPEADGVEPRGRVRGDVLGEGRVQRRDGRRASFMRLHERRLVGSLCRAKPRRASGGFVSSFATR